MQHAFRNLEAHHCVSPLLLRSTLYIPFSQHKTPYKIDFEKIPLAGFLANSLNDYLCDNNTAGCFVFSRHLGSSNCLWFAMRHWSSHEIAVWKALTLSNKIEACDVLLTRMWDDKSTRVIPLFPGYVYIHNIWYPRGKSVSSELTRYLTTYSLFENILTIEEHATYLRIYSLSKNVIATQEHTRFRYILAV